MATSAVRSARPTVPSALQSPSLTVAVTVKDCGLTASPKLILNWPVWAPVGTVAVILVDELMVKAAWPLWLNRRSVAWSRLVPFIVMTVPMGPDVGLKLVMDIVPAVTVTVAELGDDVPPAPVQVNV